VEANWGGGKGSGYNYCFRDTRIIAFVKQTLRFIVRWMAQGFENRLFRDFLVTETIEPGRAGFTAKPGQLPFSVVSDVLFCLLDCALYVAVSLEILHHPPVTMGAKCIRVRRHSLSQQTFNLLNQTGGEVFLSSLIDEPV
jgi:hypothetical protein